MCFNKPKGKMFQSLPISLSAFYLCWYLDNVPSYHPMQFPGKLKDQILRKWQKI